MRLSRESRWLSSRSENDLRTRKPQNMQASDFKL
jgi:hypothetical protein